MGGGVAQPQYFLYHKCNAVECVKATEQLTDLWTFNREGRETHTHKKRRSAFSMHDHVWEGEKKLPHYSPSLLHCLYTHSLKTGNLKKSTHHIIRTRDLKNFARSLKNLPQVLTFSASNERAWKSSKVETEEKLAASGGSIFNQRVWHPPLTAVSGLFVVLQSRCE